MYREETKPVSVVRRGFAVAAILCAVGALVTGIITVWADSHATEWSNTSGVLVAGTAFFGVVFVVWQMVRDM